ncbi:MAG: class I SAM-dependent methyltransferase [Magnetococcales bacterium]|nr:class I SAM-dependent methyltransferase [Magnetococcales bacterium]NGZ05988.1 class I SAM-dependent methyltransferase [Magnetococcales bacterium]
MRLISHCRMCGSARLEPVLSLGEMAMTGIFPRSAAEMVPVGPLELVQCLVEPEGSGCGLLQLAHDFDLDLMYGQNYGYRSGLNHAMVRHLQGLVGEIMQRVHLQPGDLVLDIGGNDGTLLNSYPDHLHRVVVDPTGVKFAPFHPPGVQLIGDFFSAAVVRRHLGSGVRARVITAVAMFYDLPAPLAFLQDVRACLAADGLVVLEMSYMPTMLERLAYDTVCHEHLEYYGLSQIDWLAQRAGLRIVDVALNDANGGSFRVFLAPVELEVAPTVRVSGLLGREVTLGLHRLEPYRHFAERVVRHREQLRELLERLSREGRMIFGYGASTKGNVLLQYCGVTPHHLPVIAEVNPDKYGCVTPGTHIPIVSEQEARAMQPDGFLVLPWHFRAFILQKEEGFLRQGGRMILPLPDIEVVTHP